MILDITGFGWTGSGAVSDFVREYSEIESPKGEYEWEFTLLHSVDGIADLEHKLCDKHVRVYDSEIAIRRFLHLCKVFNNNESFGYSSLLKGKLEKFAQEYIDSLIQFQYKGRSCFYDNIFPNHKLLFKQRINGLLSLLLSNRISRKIFGNSLYHKYALNVNQSIRVSYNPDNFLLETQNFLAKIFDDVRIDKNKIFLTDQLFPADSPLAYSKYIAEDCKCIVVRRDPRDLYILAKYVYHGNIPIPTDVYDFIIYYKEIIEKSYSPDSQFLLNLKYEDMIYEYDVTKIKIEQFLGIKDHVSKLSIFNPSKSIHNTKLFDKIEVDKKEIALISESLSASLYNFPESSVNFNSRIVF